ncbi:MAG: response regulator [Nitrospinae bacterium]|nr:response regulator [Nitrospinota bacterium]
MNEKLRTEKQTVRVLLIEDNPGDVRLIQEMLKEADYAGFELSCVESLGEALKLLEKIEFDVILVDLGLPDSQGLETLRKIYTKVSDSPIVVFTGLSDEHIGIQAVREGAEDYLVKGEVNPNLLIRVIRYAIERKQIEKEKERIIFELRKALSDIKTLKGLIPICASCKKIRNDKGYWEQVEKYIREHSSADFTHTICPDCAKKLYPDFIIEDK